MQRQSAASPGVSVAAASTRATSLGHAVLPGARLAASVKIALQASLIIAFVIATHELGAIPGALAGALSWHIARLLQVPAFST
jgi:hypothetical protein